MTNIIPFSSGWEFSRDNAPFEKVNLPHAAFPEPVNIAFPHLGAATYRKSFAADPSWKDKVVLLEIDGAMQISKIYINDRYIFTHFGGYQKFYVALADELRLGAENTVRIELDNHPTDDMPPGKPVSTLDFCYHSGIQRGARLIVHDKLHISDELAVSIPAGGGVFIRTESVENGTAHLSATCHVMNEEPPSRRFEFLGDPLDPTPVTVKLSVTDDTGREIAAAVSEEAPVPVNCDHTFSIVADIPGAPLWEAESPRLCTARFDVVKNDVVIDSREVRFGIRTIRFMREGFFLNGRKVALLGTNRHSEFPVVGNAAPANAQKRDAILIKSAGHNFVRLSHYNQHPAFIEACDELGLLVMPAIPGWQYYGRNEHFYNNAFRDCRELVRSLRNHPSVILWEVSLNESYPPNWLNAQFHRIAHEEYPGEQCYTAGDTIGNFEGWDVLFVCDKLVNKEKPIVIREYGDYAFGGSNSTSRRSRKDGVKALLGQAWNFQWTLNRALATEGVVATADWCFIDYNRGCTPVTEQSGTVDLFRVPKPKYWLYLSQTAKEPVLHAFRDADKVVVFSNCNEVELRAVGSASRRQKPDAGPDTPYNPEDMKSPGWETAQTWNADNSGGNPYDGGNARHLPHPPFTFTGVTGAEVEVVGLADGKATVSQRLVPPGAVAAVKTELRTYGVAPVADDLVFADAVLVDAGGNIVPEMRTVKFDVEGGLIVGLSGPTEAGIASCLIRVADPSKLALKATL